MKKVIKAKTPKHDKRPMGMDRKSLWVADDFDKPDPELEALFHGDLPTPRQRIVSTYKSTTKQ